MELNELQAVQRGDKRPIWDLVLRSTCDRGADIPVATRGPMTLAEARKAAKDIEWMFDSGRIGCWLGVELADASDVKEEEETRAA